MKHDALIAQLREKIVGAKLLRLIGRYLRAGVELPDGTREATPQGCATRRSVVAVVSEYSARFIGFIALRCAPDYAGIELINQVLQLHRSVLILA